MAFTNQDGNVDLNIYFFIYYDFDFDYDYDSAFTLHLYLGLPILPFCTVLLPVYFVAEVGVTRRGRPEDPGRLRWRP